MAMRNGTKETLQTILAGEVVIYCCRVALSEVGWGGSWWWGLGWVGWCGLGWGGLGREFCHVLLTWYREGRHLLMR